MGILGEFQLRNFAAVFVLDINDMSLFATFNASLFGGWIPIVLVMCVQFLMMLLLKDGARRAVDTSWYTPKDKAFAAFTFLLQATMILLGIFSPVKVGTPWVPIGVVIFVIAVVLMVWAFVSYGAAPVDEAVTGGVYRISRNPMYTSFFFAVIAAAVATASLPMLVLLVLYVVVTHRIVLAEERYCSLIYGEPYVNYMNSTSRYFLFL